METQDSVVTPAYPPVETITPGVDDLDAVGKEVDAALLEIVASLTKTDDDPDQEGLVTSVQKHRALLLKFATLAYMRKPNSAMLLTSIISLVAAMEKAVRDDRKEKAKKEENETNQYSFSQIVESLNAIASGAVVTPTFTLTSFILDPTKSLLDVEETFKPIKPEELVQGNEIVDLEGKVI